MAGDRVGDGRPLVPAGFVHDVGHACAPFLEDLAVCEAIQIAKPFANIISEDIENQIRIQSSAAQATCFPSELGVLIVSGVTKFNNNGVVVGADVSISLIQAK